MVAADDGAVAAADAYIETHGDVMAARQVKIGSKFEGEQYDVLQVKDHVVHARIYKVNKQGILLGWKDVELPSTKAPDAVFVNMMGGMAKVRERAMTQRMVEIRATVQAKSKGNGKSSDRPF